MDMEKHGTALLSLTHTPAVQQQPLNHSTNQPNKQTLHLHIMSHAAGSYTRHGGAPVPKAGPFYRYSATFLGATMWFWMFYRAKHDWKHWVGIEHPWDHQH